MLRLEIIRLHAAFPERGREKWRMAAEMMIITEPRIGKRKAFFTEITHDII